MTTLQDSDLAYALWGARKPSPYDARRKFAYAIGQRGMDFAPVDSPWQGAAKLANALAGAVGLYAADRDEKAAQSKLAEQLAGISKITDPNERIDAYTQIDPEMGMKYGGQLAVEQAKLKQQGEQLQAGANSFGGAYGAQTAPPLPQGATPPGAFANNAGNIRATNINWEGKGAPQNGFETFATPQAGANAMARNFGAYTQQNPNMTVAQAIAKWAPPNENNTQAYIARLSEATGINPGMPLAQVMQDPAVFATLMDGVTRIEKGGLPQGFTADTFMQAANPGAMAGPQAMQQGGAPSGMPPAPNPAAVNGPTITAQPPAVPDVPRPQPSPQQIQQFQQRIRSGEFGTGPDAISRARTALDADLDRQWAVDRERAKMGFEQKQRAFEAEDKSRRELEQKAPMELLAKRMDDYEKNGRPKGAAAVNDILSINQVRQLLDAGAITGVGAEARTWAGKLGELVGIPSDQVTNSQVLMSALANRVISGVGGSLGSGFSNADRDFFERAKGGQITMTEPALRRLMDIGERQARQAIQQHAEEVRRLKGVPGVSTLGNDFFALPDAPDYDTWSKANPLASPRSVAPPQPAPGALQGGDFVPYMQPNGFARHPNPDAPTNMPPQQGAPGGIPEGATATNPQTGQKIMRRGGQWVPVQ